LNQRIWPQRAGLETTVHKFTQTGLSDGDEARNVAAVVLNDSIAKVKYVHTKFMLGFKRAAG
jgi:hypothetical protein